MHHQSSSPYFFVKSNYPSRATLFLQSTKADVKIAGSIANVTVEQVYVNTIQRIYDVICIFPGGEAELMKHLAENLKYPANHDVQGKVILRFVIDENGNVNDNALPIKFSLAS